MAKVTLREVVDVLRASHAPRRPTAADVAALLTERTRQRAVRRALRRAVRKGLLLRLGRLYRLAYGPRRFRIRTQHTSAHNSSSSSKESGGSRLASVRDSLELNKRWRYKKHSIDVEHSSPSGSVDVVKDDSSALPVEKHVGFIGLEESNNDSVTLPKVLETPKKINYWSFLRFW